MTQEEIEIFIHNIYKVAKEHPEIQSRVVQAFQQGTNEYISNLQIQLADMETIAMSFAALTESKSKSTKLWSNGLILSKLKKHQNVSAINWTSNIEKVENYLKEEGLIDE
jgi:hypothetical protein